MTITQEETEAREGVLMTLTYEEYMAEGEVNLRYDIIDGQRIIFNPTRQYQHTLFNICLEFRAFQHSTRLGHVVHAPCDILIQRVPFRTRQPDVLFMSNERWAQNPLNDDPTPLKPAPELVVEIVSPSDTRGVLTKKLRDYQAVDVLECWVVRSGPLTVEVLRLTPQDVQPVQTYQMGETVQSVVFPACPSP